MVETINSHNYLLYPIIADAENITTRQILAGVNWSNTYAHKTYKMNSRKLNIFAKLVEERVMPYVIQMSQTE